MYKKIVLVTGNNNEPSFLFRNLLTVKQFIRTDGKCQFLAT